MNNRRGGETMRKVVAWIACALLVSVPAGVSVAQEPAANSLVVQDADMSSFPRVTMEVTLPMELYGAGASAPVFTVLENGKSREVLSARPISAKRAPVDIVLVIDTSGSMRGAPMEHAKDAAIAFIDMADAQDKIAIVSFASSVTVVSGFTDDKASLRRAVAGLQARGETALYDGVRKTPGLFDKRTGRDAVILLLSDGGDTASFSTLDEAVATLEASGIPLFAIGLKTPETDMNALATLAARARGRLVGVESSAELKALYASIARELATRFEVVYESAAPNTKDLEIQIVAEAQGRSASANLVVENPYFRTAVGEGEGTRPASPAKSLMLAGTIVLLSFVAMVLGAGTLLFMLFARSDRIEQLRYYDQLSGGTDSSSTRAAGIASVMQAAVAGVAGKRGLTKVLREKLERAGLPLRPVEYMYFHIVAVVGAGLSTQLLTGSLALSFLIVAVAIVMPMLLLENAIDKRRRAFEEQLPEILSLIAGSLRSGWGIQQALDLVVQEMGEPAVSELRRVQAETRLGLSIEEALEKMAERLDSNDFRWTVTAIAIQREVGGNLAEVLDVLSNTMRERAELRRHVHALTSEGRLSAIVLFVLPFAMFVLLFLVNPIYIETLFTTPAGLVLLLIGGLLLIVGGVWLNRATKVEI